MVQQTQIRKRDTYTLMKGKITAKKFKQHSSSHDHSPKYLKLHLRAQAAPGG
jgi:hypothetical protein